MSSELIINSSRDKSRIGLLKDKKLVEFHQESDETKFNVGDIYVGKVKKINKSLNAAFIDIGFEKDAFLHGIQLMVMMNLMTVLHPVIDEIGVQTQNEVVK